MNLLPPSFCIKISTYDKNIILVYTELTKLCKKPVKLPLKYYSDNLGEKGRRRGWLSLLLIYHLYAS